MDVEKSRRRLEVRGTALLGLSFQAIGIIYADLSASPLYTLGGIWPASGPAPSEEDIIGGISCIIWALTLLPLIKYVVIALEFGTSAGEGGTFALFQGLYPKRSTLSGHTLIDEGVRLARRPPPRLKWPLLLWSLLGTALTLADGVFTPAVSVVSAVSGIAVAKPSIASQIVPISIGFLILLFVLQPLGVHRLAFAFSPIMILWHVLIAAIGIYNVTRHPMILHALDPSRAVMLFVRTKNYDILSGVVLALTGCEAMFASMGQFNALSIRLSFSTLIYPTLVIAYLGQGAGVILGGASTLPNPFYSTLPGSKNGPLFWLVYVVSIFVTLIASQALVTATFSLVQQLVHMGSFPPIRIKNTSDLVQGQIYLPLANWTLMILTVVVVAAFKDITAMTNAFGFAVATVMFVTTGLVASQMYYVKGWHFVVSLSFFLVAGFLDGLLWGATLEKVPHGAWAALLIGAIMYFIMLIWTWAQDLEDVAARSHGSNFHDFVQALEGSAEKTPAAKAECVGSSEMEMVECAGSLTKVRTKSGEHRADEAFSLARLETCAIFPVHSEDQMPHALSHLLRQWPALPRILIFISTQVLPVAHIKEEERYHITRKHDAELFYSCVDRRGFRDEAPYGAGAVVEQVMALEAVRNQDSARRQSTLATIHACYAHRCTRVVPCHHVFSKPIHGRGVYGSVRNTVRAFLLEVVYGRMVTLFDNIQNAENNLRVGVRIEV